MENVCCLKKIQMPSVTFVFFSLNCERGPALPCGVAAVWHPELPLVGWDVLGSYRQHLFPSCCLQLFSGMLLSSLTCPLRGAVDEVARCLITHHRACKAGNVHHQEAKYISKALLPMWVNQRSITVQEELLPSVRWIL